MNCKGTVKRSTLVNGYSDAVPTDCRDALKRGTLSNATDCKGVLKQDILPDAIRWGGILPTHPIHSRRCIECESAP